MLNRSASLAMSTSVLKALPGKLDIKIHSPSILYAYRQFIDNNRTFLCMHNNLRRTVRTKTYGDVLQRTENDLKPLFTVELTTFKVHQRTSTNVKI